MSDLNKTSSSETPVGATTNTAATGGFFEPVNDTNSSSSDAFVEKQEDEESSTLDGNILTQYSEKQVMDMGRNYARKNGMDEELFAKGAAIARNPTGFNRMNFLSQDEKELLHEEAEHPYKLPFRMIYLIAVCSMGAAVQGMDESVINGADLFWPSAFGLSPSTSDRDSWLEGLVNSAPYLCCSCIGCWLTDPLNAKFGRKWTIFITCMISALTCFWQGFTNTWYHLFIARFFLGFGIGPKSATIPVYAAECTPAKIRGSLVMMWQLWTAFGIMFGYVMCLAFYRVPDHGIGDGLGWRLMLGSALIPAVFCCAQIWQCPESPKWLMGNDRHQELYESYRILRNHDIQAARDSFYQYVLFLEEESYNISYLTKFKELFTVRRNRNAALGSWIVMFMQQFCGINVIAYYSSSIFVQGGFSELNALIASWGFGMLNTVFALPAVFTIDKFGRRTLLLFAFPLMALFLLMAGFGFWYPGDTSPGRLAIIILGIYLFTIVYSTSEGPVPFTYSAECHQLSVRDVGMSFATATCWFFNFILSLTWPSLLRLFKSQGAFGWYAAWNLVGFFMVLWFLPETKSLTLEELDEVFSISCIDHANYQTKLILRNFKVYILRKDVPPLPPLYRHQRMAVTNAAWEDKGVAEHVEG